MCIYLCVCVGSRTVLVADPDCPLISCFHSTCQPLPQQLEWADCPLYTMPGPGTTQVSETGFSFWGFLCRLYQLNPDPKFWNRKCCQIPNFFEHCKGPESFDLQSVWDFRLFWYWSSSHVALGTWPVFTGPLCKETSFSSSCLNPGQVPNARPPPFSPNFHPWRDLSFPTAQLPGCSPCSVYRLENSAVLLLGRNFYVHGWAPSQAATSLISLNKYTGGQKV